MAADVWTCSNCHTVNTRHRGSCMVCHAAETAPSDTGSSARRDTPVTKIHEVSAPGRYPAATSVTTSAERRTRAEVRADASRAPFTPVAPSPTRYSPSPPPPPAKVPVKTPKPFRIDRARRIATGKFLGLAHIGLFMTAVLIALGEFSWLHWAYHANIAADVASWQFNPVIRDATEWSNHLPWGSGNGAYLVLAAACFVVRVVRRIPGWLSLVIALVSALYGGLTAVSLIPAFAIYWPVSVSGLILSWVIVRKTLRLAM
jgi:hypothetical protein